MESIINEVVKHCSEKLGLEGLPQPRIDRDFVNTDLAFSIHAQLPQGKNADVEGALKKIVDDAQAKLAQNV